MIWYLLKSLPGVLWLMGSQRVGHDWATELNWTELKIITIINLINTHCLALIENERKAFFLVMKTLRISSLISCISHTTVLIVLITLYFIFLAPIHNWKFVNFDHLHLTPLTTCPLTPNWFLCVCSLMYNWPTALH